MITAGTEAAAVHPMIVVALIPAIVSVAIFVATLRLGTDPADRTAG